MLLFLMVALARAAHPSQIRVRGAAYEFVPGAGMYRRRDSGDGPKWIDPEANQERLYDDRGWGAIGREGADDNDESAADFVGDGAAYVPFFADAGSSEGPLSVSPLGYDATPRPPRTAGLSAVAEGVLLRGRTEPKHAYELADGASFKDAVDAGAVFYSASSGLPVFVAGDAYDARSGWPAFSRPIDGHVVYRPDGGQREVLDAASGAHLGHAIEESGRVRFCINAAALVTSGGASPVAAARAEAPAALARLLEGRDLAAARFAMGCFWGVQRLFDQVPGVLRTTAGTSDGCEAVDIAYDPAVVDYADLLELFFASHDPTVFRAVGEKEPGVGKYRNEIHAFDADQRREAERVLRRVAGGLPGGACASAVVAASAFEAAPEKDQHLYRRRRGLDFSEKWPVAVLAALPNKLED